VTVAVFQLAAVFALRSNSMDHVCSNSTFAMKAQSQDIRQSYASPDNN